MSGGGKKRRRRRRRIENVGVEGGDFAEKAAATVASKWQRRRIDATVIAKLLRHLKYNFPESLFGSETKSSSQPLTWISFCFEEGLSFSSVCVCFISFSPASVFSVCVCVRPPRPSRELSEMQSEAAAAASFSSFVLLLRLPSQSNKHAFFYLSFHQFPLPPSALLFPSHKSFESATAPPPDTSSRAALAGDRSTHASSLSAAYYSSFFLMSIW